jgi:hypothetical protein
MVDFEDGWLIKSSFITKDEQEACQLTKPKVQKNNIFWCLTFISRCVSFVCISHFGSNN